MNKENIQKVIDALESCQKSSTYYIFNEDEINKALLIMQEELNKPMPDPASMTNARPTAPGWYWYELPGSWELQPALVFDAGYGSGLYYTLDPIESEQNDTDRDGFAMDKCCESSRWSSAPIYAYSSAPEQKPACFVRKDIEQEYLHFFDFKHGLVVDSKVVDFVEHIINKISEPPASSKKKPMSDDDIANIYRNVNFGESTIEDIVRAVELFHGIGK